LELEMRTRMTILIAAALAALAALGLASTATACSQCMCGTPFPADALGGVVPMELRYGLEDRYLSKSNGLEEEPGTEAEREHRVGGFVLWRATNRLALLGRLPYNVKSIEETPEGGPTTTRTQHGLGDAEATALVGLVHTEGRHGAVLGMVLGAAAPTGSNGKRDDTGERLDEHLQPGIGAWSGTAGLNYAIQLGGGTVDASVMGRLNGTNAHDYHYGNALLYNAGWASPFRHGVRLLVQLNGRTAERDRIEADTEGANTGGTVVYASPGLRWQTGFGIDVEGAVQIPMIESLYGIQDEHVTARIAFSLGR
jgi:hypothetical protein